MFLDIPNEFDGPPITEDQIAVAEYRLGFPLAESYVAFLRQRNGGILVGCHIRVTEKTFYGDCVLPIFGIMGIGGEWSVNTILELPEDNPEANLPLGISKLRSLGYSGSGFVFSRFGHSVYAMDYSRMTAGSEPRIIYIDWEYPADLRVMKVADSFGEMLQMIVCAEQTDNTIQ